VSRVAVHKLSDLIAQPAATSFLKGVVARGRPANAYLFTGPAGAGKGTAALAFARALLCERVPGGAAGVPGPSRCAGAAPAAPLDDACGTCGSCVKSGDLQHPDLKFLFPVMGEEKSLDETVAETLRSVREDDFPVFVYDRFASIRLSLTRELLRELAYHPFEATRRVVVVRDADRMREDQYSAMLKSLEEPGGFTAWVLTSSRPFRLPATIRSRCQQVRFAPLPEPAIRAVLEQRAGVGQAEARLLAALSAGNLARALRLRGTDTHAERTQAMALLEPALRGDAAKLWAATQRFMNFGRTGRETLRRMFEIHQLRLRDVLRVQAGAPVESLANGDQLAELRREAAQVTAREIRRRLMVIEEALQSIEGNVSPELTLFSSIARVAGERYGEGRWPEHATSRSDY